MCNVHAEGHLVAVVLVVLDQGHEGLQPAVGLDEGARLLLLGALEDGAGAVFAQLHVVVEEVADEVLDHALGLDGHAVALLGGALLQRPDHGDQQRDVPGLDQPRQEGKPSGFLDQQPVPLRST